MLQTLNLVGLPLYVAWCVGFYFERVSPHRNRSYIFPVCNENTGWKYFNYRRSILVAMVLFPFCVVAGEVAVYKYFWIG